MYTTHLLLSSSLKTVSIVVIEGIYLTTFIVKTRKQNRPVTRTQSEQETIVTYTFVLIQSKSDSNVEGDNQGQFILSVICMY